MKTKDSSSLPVHCVYKLSLSLYHFLMLIQTQKKMLSLCRLASYLPRSESSSLYCWSWSWWGSRKCPPHLTARGREEAAAQPGRPADRTLTSTWTTGWRIDPTLDTTYGNSSLVVCASANTPGDEHFLLDVGQKLRVILASEVQTFSMEAEDLQAVQHVEQNVRLLKLGHFLKMQKERWATQPLHTQINKIIWGFSYFRS